MNGSIENELWIAVVVLFNVFFNNDDLRVRLHSNRELTIPPRPNYMLSFRFISYFFFEHVLEPGLLLFFNEYPIAS